MKKMIALLFGCSSLLGMNAAASSPQPIDLEMPMPEATCPYGAVESFFTYGKQGAADMPASLVIKAKGVPALHLTPTAGRAAPVTCQRQGMYHPGDLHDHTCVLPPATADAFASGIIVSSLVSGTQASPICAIAASALPAGFVDEPTAVVTKREGDLVTIEVHGALKKRVINTAAIAYAQQVKADALPCTLDDLSDRQQFLCVLKYDLSKPDRQIPNSVFIQALPNPANPEIGTGVHVSVAKQVGYSPVEGDLCPENSSVSWEVDQSSPDAARESAARYGRCICDAGFVRDAETGECLAAPAIRSTGENDGPRPERLRMNRGGACAVNAHAAAAPASWIWMTLPWTLWLARGRRRRDE